MFNGYCENTTFINCIFTNNTAGQYGGAIMYSSYNFTIINSTFIDNTATWGGVIFGQPAYSNSTGLTIISSNFTNNTATTGGGGVIYNDINNYMLINCTFTNNTAALYGGAIHNNGGNFTIINSAFINNTATNYGGAIYNTGANMSVNNSNFTNNTATIYGGAIYNTGTNTSVNNSNFTNNTSNTFGGAIYNAGANWGVNKSNFIGNNAFNHGGAIYNNGINASIISSNFVNNTASIGGGIFNNQTMLVSGNIMEGNIASTLGNEIYNNGSMGILNLTYLNNSTVTVKNNTYVILNATLTDDMGNLVTGGNISFFVNGTFIGNAEAIEGVADINYFVNQGDGIVPVTGDYAAHPGFDIILRNGQLLIVSNNTVNSEITLDKDVYQINETVKGTITTTNTGNNTVTNVTTRVNFPSNFVLDPGSIVVSHGTFDPTTNIWSIGDLAPGEVATMTFTGKFITAGESTISLETSGDNFETSTASVTALVEQTPTPPTPPTPPEPPEPRPHSNETTNVSAVTSAAMKETGIPIIALLILLISAFGLSIRSKKINFKQFRGLIIFFNPQFLFLLIKFYIYSASQNFFSFYLLINKLFLFNFIIIFILYSYLYF
ncbi:hypothetical protein [Methanobrevibacter arboriphilus]|uniref:hypothetical protein n=1 Tax=Methanobrevibacter arboriphilus TaxID=39441 RepID=UPI00373FD546